MTAVADVLGTIHGDHKFYLQQLYVNFKLNHFFAEIGSREIEPILRSRRLSSGNIIESGNAKPIPQLRIGTDGFWTVPGLNKWLEVYFDGAYGKYIDGGYKQDVATTLQATFTRGMWMHHKKLYLRSNSQKLFYGMIGIDHFVQFGVQRYAFVDGQMVLIKDSPATRYLLLASRSQENPVPAMLGAATHVIVTEDSVSMASEAATAGFRVGLLRVEKKQSPLTKLRRHLGGGTVKFDALFTEMAARGLVDDLGTTPDFDSFLATEARKTDVPFNEAKRAAEWILSRWPGK